MMPNVVRFSCSQNPFRVTIIACSAPECDCTHLFFTLQEVTDDGRLVTGGLTLKIRVDGDTWQEVAAPPRDRVADQIVRELLDDYPASGKAYLQQQAREKRRVARRLRTYRFPDHVFEDGKLILFRDIISEGLEDRLDTASFAYQWEHGGDLYLLDDLYCPNPVCKCRDVHVAFLHCHDAGSDRPLAIKERFVAIVSLDGRWRIDECYTCTEAEAKALLRAWRKEEPDHLEKLRWRYHKVKEIAKRGPHRRIRLPEDDDVASGRPLEMSSQLPLGLPEDEAEAASGGEPVAGVVRVGRNEPCPCGSGKKYKKCCGRQPQPK